MYVHTQRLPTGLKAVSASYFARLIVVPDGAPRLRSDRFALVMRQRRDLLLVQLVLRRDEPVVEIGNLKNVRSDT